MRKNYKCLSNRNGSNLKGTVLPCCDHCLIGKQPRITFVRNINERKGNILDLVYSYVYGPINVKIIGGVSYFVTSKVMHL